MTHVSVDEKTITSMLPWRLRRDAHDAACIFLRRYPFGNFDPGEIECSLLKDQNASLACLISDISLGLIVKSNYIYITLLVIIYMS